MASSELTLCTVACEDYLEFQETLKRMRAIDDKIIYALNTTIPTDSFRSQVNVSDDCKNLYDQLQHSYGQRESAIKHCIAEVSERVRHMKDQLATDPNNINYLKSLRKEQSKLRLMQAEVNVEEVVKDRSLKVFYERCRSSYKPPNIVL